MLSVEEYLTSAFADILKYAPSQKPTVFIHPDDAERVLKEHPLLRDAFEWNETDLIECGKCMVSMERFDPLKAR